MRKTFAVDAATNRLGVPVNQAGTMLYDAAGNLTADTYTGTGTRTYDAENRMTSAQGASISLGTYTNVYTYDAAGRRTRRQTEGTEVWQVYGLEGELVAEYAGGAAPAVPQKEYAYRNGEMLVVSEGTTTATTGDSVWVEDALPAGAQTSAGGINETWNWVTNAPSPASGASSNRSPSTAGLHQQYFQDATQTMAVAAGDNLVAFVYLDPASPPTEVMLQWQDGAGSFEHRAYWGANQIGWGVDGTSSRRYLGTLPAAGKWVRLEVPAAAVGLVGQTVKGLGLTLYGGRANWDRVGKAAPEGPQWLVSDHLGTPRMIADKTGNMLGIKRHDYLPFGEELNAGQGGRTTAQGYAGDNVRQQFTGYERDDETELDYAQARYFSGMQGRFTSVDPLAASATPANPQTFNRYSYALNSPLKYTDPTGMISTSLTSACGGACQNSDGGSGSGAGTSGGIEYTQPIPVVQLPTQSDSSDANRSASQAAATSQNQANQQLYQDSFEPILCGPNSNITDVSQLPPLNFREASVNYHEHTVSDQAVVGTLEQFSIFLGRTVHLTSGDRSRIVNGNRTSAHLRGAAADFYIQGLSLGDAYSQLRQSGLVPTMGFEFIYHTEVTTAPHLHLGHRPAQYSNTPTRFVVDTGQILPRRRR